MSRLLPILALSLLTLAGCGAPDDKARLDDYQRRPVTLPDGTTVRAEVMFKEDDMRRGMMFRDSLPEGDGMLFIHGSPGEYSYWMYQVKVPLDIIWMDSAGTIVEIVENAPPCKTAASKCPNFGGTKRALVILELPGGYARKHGVAVGKTIRF